MMVVTAVKMIMGSICPPIYGQVVCPLQCSATFGTDLFSAPVLLGQEGCQEILKKIRSAGLTMI